MSENAVAHRDETALAEVQDYSAGILSVIERAVRDPSVDIDKMERLFALQERVLERSAKAAFTAAKVTMAPRLPAIDQRGRIVIRDKSDSKKIIQETPFARFEDIHEAVMPILTEEGFDLAFRNGMAPDGKVRVTTVLSHIGGHSEETYFDLPHDSSGSKNAVQAIGSSTSYARRYGVVSILNLRVAGEDDNGVEASNMRAGGEEPMPRAKLEGVYPSAAKLKEALREFSNKLRTTGDVNALQLEYKDALNQALRDLPVWISGDGSHENIGIKAAVANRREELANNPSFQMLLKGLERCDTTQALSTYADSHSALLDDLDDAERREFERAYDARESAVKTLGSRN
jgi:hypothetical protein